MYPRTSDLHFGFIKAYWFARFGFSARLGAVNFSRSDYLAMYCMGGEL